MAASPSPRLKRGSFQSTSMAATPKPTDTQRLTEATSARRLRPRLSSPEPGTAEPIEMPHSRPAGRTTQAAGRYNPRSMTVFDRRRLAASVFKLDVERMRRGWYSDKYFINIASTLGRLASEGYRFGGSAPDLAHLPLDLGGVDVGSIEVEMQWFP